MRDIVWNIPHSHLSEDAKPTCVDLPHSVLEQCGSEWFSAHHSKRTDSSDLASTCL